MPVRIATSDGIAGTRVVATLDVVLGIAVRSRGVGGNIMAGLGAIGNGSALDDFRDELVSIRHEALARMARAAEDLGANAVICTRFDTAEVGHEMVEVVAYGTAAIVQSAASPADRGE
jgi:uncharacterized protein YbjQ (UPF0145 family)